MATSQLTGAPNRADHPVDSDPSADEALRRVRGEQAMSAADRAAHEAASYVRTKPTRTLTSYDRREVRDVMARIGRR
jgi:hypothetical protein